MQSVELLSPQGRNPGGGATLKGKIAKTFDKSVKGYVFTMGLGGKVVVPKGGKPLNLRQGFLMIQLNLALGKVTASTYPSSSFVSIRRRLLTQTLTVCVAVAPSRLPASPPPRTGTVDRAVRYRHEPEPAADLSLLRLPRRAIGQRVARSGAARRGTAAPCAVVLPVH